MRVYISGPMAGIKDHNFPAFHAADRHLTDIGYDTVNPAIINKDGGTRAYCMRRDIFALLDCKAIYLLPGWEKSKGALLEVEIAKQLDLEFKYAKDAESAAC